MNWTHFGYEVSLREDSDIYILEVFGISKARQDEVEAGDGIYQELSSITSYAADDLDLQALQALAKYCNQGVEVRTLQTEEDKSIVHHFMINGRDIIFQIYDKTIYVAVLRECDREWFTKVIA